MMVRNEEKEISFHVALLLLLLRRDGETVGYMNMGAIEQIKKRDKEREWRVVEWKAILVQRQERQNETKVKEKKCRKKKSFN